MSVVAPEVRAGWVAFSTPLEGCVPTMYLDVKGLVTTAIGALVDSPAAALQMTWSRPDGSTATPDEVVRDWRRVKALPPALRWERYQAPGCLHLEPDELERVTLERLDDAGEILAVRWPNFSDWPAQAQAALCSLAWAVGPGASGSGLTGPSWPHLHAALLAGDWRAAAEAGQLRSDGNPGVVPRNLATAALFLLASGASEEEARAGWRPGPSEDAAVKALAAFSWGRDTLPSGAPEVEQG